MNEDDRWEASTVLPAQFFGGPAAVLQPEKRLMLAVLENAVWLLLHPLSARDDEAQRQLAEARLWLASDDLAWPFTFLNVCEALGLDPDALRGGLQRRAGRRGEAGAGPLARQSFALRRVVSSRHRVGGRRRAGG
jgi:hypothetical protein